MLVLESDERHGIGKGMKRADYGTSPHDKSHEVLRRARAGNGWAANDFFNGMTLAELRDHVHAKANNPFPAPRQNMCEWWTRRPLSTLHLEFDERAPYAGSVLKPSTLPSGT
jgi:hypothetical protein